jgi:hypothetical protein
MERFMHLAAICLAAVAFSSESKAASYEVGQVWEYKTRPQDAGSLLKIQRITTLDKETVYHLSVIGIRFASPTIAGILPHIPVSKQTLDLSVTKLSQSKAAFPTSAVDEGIAEWERAKGGVFNIPVSEIVDIGDMQTSQIPTKQ